MAVCVNPFRGQGTLSWNEQLLCFGCFLLLVVASNSLISTFFLLCFHSVSSVVISDLPVSPFLTSKNSAISLSSGGALSMLVAPAGDSACHVVLFVLLHCQLSSVMSFYSLPVSLSLRLSMISAISLISGGALSTLVSIVGVSSHRVLFLLSTINLLQFTVGESSRHFFGFPFYYQLSSIMSVSIPSVSLSLRLSRISAISLYSGGALSALVTSASGHVTVSLPFDYLHSTLLLLFTLFSYLILDISGTLKCATLTNWFLGCFLYAVHFSVFRP